MTKIRLKHIHEYRDRHGKVRRYVRLSGRQKVPLLGAPGTEAFMEAYAAALAGEAVRIEIGPSRTKPGTVNAAVISYFNSTAFQALAFDPVRRRRNILERWRVEHGDKRIGLLQREHIARMVTAKAATPSAARNFLNTLRALMAHCLTHGLITIDPTQGVKRSPIKTSGYRTWTEGDIAAFEAKHPIGSRARLALALLIYTAQRRSDVVLLGRQHSAMACSSFGSKRPEQRSPSPCTPRLSRCWRLRPANT
jgi:hypothetical protein